MMDHAKHARYAWTCPICFRVIVGNGGKSSHKIAHVRRGDAHPAWVKRYGWRYAPKDPV